MTNDDDRIDFSPLDPSRDRWRWEQLIASTTARVVARRRPSLWEQLTMWARPALAAAALAVIIAGGATWVASPDRVEERRDPTVALLSWANAEESPSVSEILDTLVNR